MQKNIKDFQLSQDYRDSAFQAEREVYESTIKQLKRRIGDLERTLILTNDELIKEKEILESQHKNFESNSDLKRKYIVESYFIKESRELLVMEEANNKSLAAKLSAQKEIIDNKNKHIQSITQLMEEMKKERERVLNEFSISKGSDLQDLAFKFNQMSKELDHLSKERDNYKFQASQASEDYIALNKKMLSRLNEMDEIRHKYINGINSLSLLERDFMSRIQNLR